MATQSAHDYAETSIYLQVTLRLCTNIEPRHGGRLDMSSLLWTSGTAGRPWEYTGPASLLKSALQKNIRRGRAEEAVRLGLCKQDMYAAGWLMTLKSELSVARECMCIAQQSLSAPCIGSMCISRLGEAARFCITALDP